MAQGRRGIVHRITHAAKNLVLKFNNDWSMNLVSMIAYNLITAIFPILLALLSIVGMVLNVFASSNLDNVAGFINSAFPETRQGGISIAPLLTSLIQLTGPLGGIALIALLWLGSNLFANIENAFSIIFRIRGRDLIQQRIMAIGMVLFLTVLLPLSLGAASLVTAGSDNFRRFLPHQAGLVLTYVGPVTTLVVLWVLFLAIYMVVPNFEVRFRQAWYGALVAALLFGLLELLFPLYFKIFLNGNTRYGAAAASLLVIIIWLWFFALITVIGAQINSILMGLVATPYDVARTFELVYAQHDLDADVKRKTTNTRFRALQARLRRRGHIHVPPPREDTVSAGYDHDAPTPTQQ